MSPTALTATEQIHAALAEDADACALELVLGPGEAIPTDLVALAELTTLRILGPGPLALPRWFGRMRGLSWLVIEPAVAELPDGLAQLDTLEHLELRCRGGFPPILAELPALRELGLVLDSLAEVPLSLAKRPALESVWIRASTLARVPLGLLVAPGLVSLSLDIAEPPPSVAAAPAFPRVLPGLGAIELLAICGWPLAEIPPVLLELERLDSLTLRRCSLTSLPADWRRALALRHLDLSANALPSLPASLTQLGALRSLVVTDNPIAAEAIDPAVSALELDRFDV